MVQLKMNGKTYELATSLRVVYALKDLTKAKTLQEAINSIGQLDMDGQLELLFAAYKAGGGKNDNTITKEEFMDTLIDTQGVFAIADTVNKIADGLLYSGMTPEEVALKKAEMEKQIQAGAASSGKVTD